MHLVGARRELKQLKQVVLIDNLAWRGGDIAPQLELIHVGLPDSQLAAAALHIGGKVLRAFQQALTLALDHGPQRRRVGH